MVTLTSRWEYFDAAHHLPFHKGKCKNVHGHTWGIEIEVTGIVKPGNHMLFDLTYLSQTVKAMAMRFDHEDINESIPNPTGENLTKYFINIGINTLTARLSEADPAEQPLGLISFTVHLQEGQGGTITRTKMLGGCYAGSPMEES